MNTIKLTEKERMVISATLTEFRVRYQAEYDEAVDTSKILDDLLELDGKQRDAFLHALQDLGKTKRPQPFQLTDIFHDLRGLADHERCFLPRIRMIADVS